MSRKSKSKIVTAQNYPAIYRAFNTIMQDNGEGSRGAFTVPDGEWPGKLDECERALASLTDEELETFCTGEYDEQVDIVMRKRRKLGNSITNAGKLLNHFFDDWEHDE